MPDLHMGSSWSRPGAPTSHVSEGTMTALQFRKQLQSLGWSMSEAAKELGVPSGKSRVGEWARGKRSIPPYIQAHMATLGQLGALKAEVLARFERGQKRRSSTSRHPNCVCPKKCKIHPAEKRRKKG